jgi:protein SCO1/2
MNSFKNNIKLPFYLIVFFFFFHNHQCISKTLFAGHDSVQVKILNDKISRLPDNESKLNFAQKAFSNANGTVDGKVVASLVDVFKEYGKSSHDVIDLMILRLKENDPLYQDRGPKEVERLRGYILSSLSQIGIDDKIIPVLNAELSFGYHPYVVAAAARVSGMVDNPQHVSLLVPLLTRYLEDTYKDDYVDLDNYGNFWPLKKPTSVRIEVVEALGKIGGANVETAVKALRKISDAEQGSYYYSDKELILKARMAITKIGSTNIFQSAMSGNSNSMHSCCSDSSPKDDNHQQTATKFNPKANVGRQVKNFKATDQNGNAFQLNSALGKPFIFTFFYTRCDNPNKCSSTVQNLSILEQEFKEEGLADKVSLFAITYEPSFDAPSVIKSYGEGRGAEFDGNFKFLTIDNKMHTELIKDLGVLVNYGKGMVNNHGSQLYVFDKKGHLAKIYENTVWKSDELVQDIKVLLKDQAL